MDGLGTMMNVSQHVAIMQILKKAHFRDACEVHFTARYVTIA
jgi:hypothetical protein